MGTESSSTIASFYPCLNPMTCMDEADSSPTQSLTSLSHGEGADCSILQFSRKGKPIHSLRFCRAGYQELCAGTYAEHYDPFGRSRMIVHIHKIDTLTKVVNEEVQSIDRNIDELLRMM